MVLDSLLFFNSFLKKLPKIFGLKLSYEKGFHLYYFYDFIYVGEIVNKKYFDLSNISYDKRIEFDKWYDSYKGEEYNFAEEIKQYCCDDVKILQLCCIEFYQKVKELCSAEPFFNAAMITIAVLSVRICKSLFMRDGMIRIIPRKGSGNNVKQIICALM